MSPTDRQVQRSAAVAGRLLEAFVFAPIGAGAKLVADGPGAVARAKQELSNARFIGEMVVGQGSAQLRERLSPTPTAAPTGASSVAVLTPDGRIDPEPVSEHVADEPEVAVGGDGTESADNLAADVLAIPDYDSLPAIDIVGLLESLNRDELAHVEVYERANRRRRTVLGKISQLSADG